MASKWRSQKGSTMVEAAVVFPLVIFTVFVLIYVMGFLYDQVAASSATHRGSLALAGESSDSYLAKKPSGVQLYTEEGLLRGEAVGTKTVRFSSGMPGVGPRSRVMRSHSYILDEKKEIRLWDLLE